MIRESRIPRGFDLHPRGFKDRFKADPGTLGVVLGMCNPRGLFLTAGLWTSPSLVCKGYRLGLVQFSTLLARVGEQRRERKKPPFERRP